MSQPLFLILKITKGTFCTLETDFSHTYLANSETTAIAGIPMPILWVRLFTALTRDEHKKSSSFE